MNITAVDTRPGQPGVHSINEFALSVPDLAEAAHFYRSFGLDVREETGALSLYTDGHPHCWGRVLQGAAKRLLWISWGVHAGELGLFEARLAACGVMPVAAPEGASGEGIWFAGPDNMPQQLVVAEQCAPRAKSPRSFAPEQSLAGRAPHRDQVRQVRPRRLSHVLVFTADVDASIRFYTSVLGLKLSDRSGALIAFMHGAHGSDHHLIAMACSDGYGFHHCSWDVASFDEVGLGNQQCITAGYARGWGLGRHVLGSNYFRYVRDPWGSYSEYSFDMDHIAPGQQWPAADHLAQDSLYVWGESPPADFIHNYETDAGGPAVAAPVASTEGTTNETV